MYLEGRRKESVSRKEGVDPSVFVYVPHFLLSMLCRTPCSLLGLLRRNTARRVTHTAETGLSQKGTGGQTPRGGRRVMSEPRMATVILQVAAARAPDLATCSESADGGGVSRSLSSPRIVLQDRWWQGKSETQVNALCTHL